MARQHRHHAPFSPLRSRAELTVIRATLTGFGKMPLERSMGVMAVLVRALGRRVKGWRRIGLENLRRAFPERDANWREKILDQSFESLGRMAAEVAHFDRLDAANIGEFVGFASPRDEELWRECVGDPGGRLIATAHFGNWELFAHAQGLMGRPVHLVHRSLRNPLLDDLLTSMRRRAGTGVIWKHAAAREVLRQAHAGQLVAIPIDQHAPGGSGIAVPFFGRPASTNPGVARVAQITRKPVQLALLSRVGTSTRHQIVMRPPRDVPRDGDRDAAVLRVMTELEAELESIVRADPGQWLWMHRRWRLD